MAVPVRRRDPSDPGADRFPDALRGAPPRVGAPAGHHSIVTFALLNGQDSRPAIYDRSSR